MSLSLVLLLTILFCALVTGIQSSEMRGAQGGALVIIVLAVIELLIARGTTPDFTGRETLIQILPAAIGILALLTTFRSKERTLSLVLMFAALLHFFVAVGVIDEL